MANSDTEDLMHSIKTLTDLLAELLAKEVELKSAITNVKLVLEVTKDLLQEEQAKLN